MKKWLLAAVPVLLMSGCKEEEPVIEDVEVNYSCKVIDYYNYDAPVPPSEAIEESYYDDVLLTGDSRMGSLYLYGTHDNAHVEYVTSLNLMLIDTMNADNHDEDITLMDVYQNSDRNHIYMLFGINGIRNKSFDPFAEQYQYVIDQIRVTHPDAELYIILSYHPDKISNLPEPQLSAQLIDINEHMIALAKENHIYYLDPDNGMDDENGTIIDDYVADGLHFTPKGAHAFEDYIATHVVRKEQYVKEICE